MSGRPEGRLPVRGTPPIGDATHATRHPFRFALRRCGCVATLQTGTPRQGDETAGAEDAGGLSAGSDELDIPKHVLVLAPSRATKNETDVGQSVTDRCF